MKKILPILLFSIYSSLPMYASELTINTPNHRTYHAFLFFTKHNTHPWFYEQPISHYKYLIKNLKKGDMVTMQLNITISSSKKIKRCFQYKITDDSKKSLGTIKIEGYDIASLKINQQTTGVILSKRWFFRTRSPYENCVPIPYKQHSYS